MSWRRETENRIEKLEDKFNYPSLEFSDSHFEEYIESKIDLKILDWIGNRHHSVSELAEALGYIWVEGGRWEKIKTKKNKN